MTLPCLVGGVTLPLGPDDVRDYLAQYGEVSTSRLDMDGRPVVDLLPSIPEDPGVGVVSAYPRQDGWKFYASRQGRYTRRAFDDLADALAYALGGRGVPQ